MYDILKPKRVSETFKGKDLFTLRYCMLLEGDVMGIAKLQSW